MAIILDLPDSEITAPAQQTQQYDLTEHNDIAGFEAQQGNNGYWGNPPPTFESGADGDYNDYWNRPPPEYNTGSDSGTGETTPTSVATRNRTENNIVGIDDVVDFQQGAKKYDILYFPTGLMNEGSLQKRYPHAMGIFMNVNSKSKLGKFMAKKDSYVAERRLDGNDLGGSSANQALGTTNNGSSASTTNAVRDTGIGLKQELKNVQGNDLEANTKRGILTAAIEVNKAFEKLSENIAKYKRFTGCIMLPIPLTIAAEYTAKYGLAGSSGLIGSVLHQATGGPNMAGDIKGVGAAVMTDLLRGEIRTIVENVTNAKNMPFTSLGGVNGGGATFDKVLGTVSNPRTEQVFQQIELRSWPFQWHLPITTVREWNTIRKIISLLKENMHPELETTDLGTYMIMPNEFDIEFYENVRKDVEKDSMMSSGTFKESETLPKIATCVLSGLRVDYTPHGHWISFEGTMIPPYVSIQATFQEVEPIHRAMVQDVGDNEGSRYSVDVGYYADGANKAAQKRRRGF
jgi:hypothetical protein